jgi:hypothetical protein
MLLTHSKQQVLTHLQKIVRLLDCLISVFEIENGRVNAVQLHLVLCYGRFAAREGFLNEQLIALPTKQFKNK